jgi:hypothetical protein
MHGESPKVKDVGGEMEEEMVEIELFAEWQIHVTGIPSRGTGVPPVLAARKITNVFAIKSAFTLSR